MPGGKDKLKKLHASLTEEGYDLPDYATFEKDMSDGGKREKLRTSLVAEGYDLPDSKTFTADMGYGEAAPKQPAIPRMIPAPDAGALADNTSVPEPVRPETAREIVATKEMVELKKRNTDEALMRSAKELLKKKGIKAEPGSNQYWNAVGELKQKVENGEAVLAYDKDGKPGLKRTTGFAENTVKAWNAAHQGEEDAAAFVKDMDAQQRLDFRNKQQAENPNPEYIGERPDGWGQVGEFVGGTGPMMVKGTAAAVVGGMITNASGGTLAGVTPVLMTAVMGNDMINQGAMDNINKQFDILKTEHPEWTDLRAMEEADKAKWLGGIGGAATAVAFSGGLKLPVGYEGKNVVMKALSNVSKNLEDYGGKTALGKAVVGTAKAGVSAGAITGVAKAATIAGREGHTTDWVDEMYNTVKDNATVGMILHGVTAEAPKLLKAAYNYAVVKSGVPPAEIEQALKTDEDAGVYAPGTTEKVMTDLAEYKEALDKTAPGLHPEAEASVAGLIQAKTRLETEKATKDKSAAPFYDEKIAAIDKQIAGIQATGDVAAHEINEITGKTYAEEASSTEKPQDSPEKALEPTVGEDSNSTEKPQDSPETHPAIEAAKTELKNGTDEGTIQTFEQRTADAVRQSESTIAAIESKAESEGEADLIAADKAIDSELAKAKAKADESGGGKEEPEGVGEMNRSKAKVHQRIKPEVRKNTEPPVKLNQAIADFADELKSKMVYTKTPRAAGTYNPRNGLIKIRNAGDLDTTAHEAGHFLDDKFDILNKLTPAAQAEIKWFSDRGGSNPPAKASPALKAEYLKREGLAEYIRALVVNPAEAMKQAPALAKEFETLVGKPEMAAIKKFSDRVIAFDNAPAGDKIISNVLTSPVIEDKKGAVEWLKSFSKSKDELEITWLDKLQDHALDGLHSAKVAYNYANGVKGIQSMLPEKNFEMLSRLFAGVNGKVDRILESGLVDAKNNVLKDNGKDMTIKWLFEPLEKTDLKTIAAEQEDVIKLLIAERTVEYASKFGRNDNLSGIGGGLDGDLNVAKAHLDDFNTLQQTDPAKFDRLKESARRYRAYSDAVMDYALEKGRISTETYDTIKESNKFYVAMTRIGEMAPMEEPLNAITGTPASLTSVKQILKKAKGGTGQIQNPYVSLIKNTADIISETDRNEVLQNFVAPLTERRSMGQGEQNILSAIGREVDMSETKNSKTIYLDGKPTKWQFDSDIYQSLTAMDKPEMSGLLSKVAMAPGQILRWSVTHFPVFAARNIVRDATSRAVLSRSNSGFKSILHNVSDRQLFDLYGGSQAGHHLINRDAYYKQLANTTKEMVKKGVIILSPRKLASSYTSLLEKGENVNRIAEFNSAYKKGKAAGLDDYNAGLQAAYEARDLMDFAVGGHTMKAINRFVPFTNAAMQGLRRSAKGIKENPGGFALRTMLYTVVPTVITRMIVHANGDDDEYEQLPAYQRDLFWNFKLPITGGKWISIPKPFDIGLPASLADRAISKGQGVENAFEGFANSVLSVMTPFDEGSLMGPYRVVSELAANKNFFLDRPIIPQDEEKMMLSKRERAAEGSRLGKSLSTVFGFVGIEADPRKIDYFIKSQASYYGDLALRLSDLGRKDSRNKFGIAQTGFMKDIQITNAKDVAAVYQYAEQLDALRDPQVRALKVQVRAFYDIKDEAKKEAAAKAIYEQSKKVRARLEAEYKKEKSK